LNESIAPRKNLPPLLVKLSERKAENLDYLGTSFGLTENLHRFVFSWVMIFFLSSSSDLSGSFHN
jgi:N-acetyltransferase 10